MNQRVWLILPWGTSGHLTGALLGGGRLYKTLLQLAGPHLPRVLVSLSCLQHLSALGDNHLSLGWPGGARRLADRLAGAGPNSHLEIPA